MQNHQHDDHGSSSMMWMMMLCCLLPMAALFFFGATSIRSPWFIGVFLIVVVGAHFWMHRKGHGMGGQSAEVHSNHTDETKKNDSDHASHGCH